MTAPMSPQELQQLRRRFVRLMILQACVGVSAVLAAAAYFVFHLAWGLGAFVALLGVALAAQVGFIWKFRTGPQ